MRVLLQVLVASASLSVSGIVVAQAVTAPAAAASAAPGTAQNPAAWFARVNNVEISVASFDQSAKEAFRKKFYHGTPPESEINLMLREVAESMIDQVLLQREVLTRKIAPDPNEVKKELDKLEQRYASSPAWQQQREQTLPNLRAHFEDKSRLKVLEESIRTVTASSDEVRAFYDKNLPLFTEPEKDRLSLILFRVDPSSSSKEWEDAQQQAEKTKAEILGGADFAQLAKERSNDRSASNGGDLGYLHRGMIAAAVETEISKVPLGALGGPTRTLEGYVVYRVDGRIASALRDFASAEPRARELFLRQKADETWLGFLEALRKSATIELGPDFEKIMQAAKPSASPVN
jgi:parvulin-like peptidyl-prolyl isomerase